MKPSQVGGVGQQSPKTVSVQIPPDGRLYLGQVRSSSLIVYSEHFDVWNRKMCHLGLNRIDDGAADEKFQHVNLPADEEFGVLDFELARRPSGGPTSLDDCLLRLPCCRKEFLRVDLLERAAPLDGASGNEDGVHVSFVGREYNGGHGV